MGGRAITDGEKELIIEYANTGRSAYEAATALCRSVGCVYAVAKRNGVAFNGGHRKVGPAPTTIKMESAPVERCPFDDIGDLEDDLIERMPTKDVVTPDNLCLLTTTSRTLEMQVEHLKLSIASGRSTVVSVEIYDILGSPDDTCQSLIRLMTEISEAIEAIDKEAKHV